MGTYYIPRNVKGESRILMIFSVKGLIYTAIGAGVGGLFFVVFRSIGLSTVGLIILAAFALIGFAIGTLKVPNTTAFEFTKKTGGENIDDVIKRAIMFKRRKKKVYVYVKEETKDE